MKSIFVRCALCLTFIAVTCSWTMAADLTVAAGQTYTVPDASNQQFDNAVISGNLIIGTGATLHILGNFTVSENTGATVTLQNIGALDVELSTQFLTGSTLILYGASRMIVDVFSTNGANMIVDLNSYFEVKDITASITSTTIAIKNGGIATFRGDINITNTSSLNVTLGGVIELYGNFINQTSTVTFDLDGELRLLGTDQKVSAIGSFYNLTLGGYGKKRLDGLRLYEVQNILNLNSALLVLDDTLLISNTRPEAIERIAGYIDAYRVKRNIDQQSLSGNYLFPLGKGDKYNPVEITPLAAEAGSYAVSLFSTAANNLNSVTSRAESVNKAFYHQIYKTGALTIADVSFFYNESQEGPFDRILTWSTSLAKWDFLQGGSSAVESGTKKGIIVHGVALSSYNNSNPGTTLFVFGTIKQVTTNTSSYVILNKELGGGFYVAQNDVLKFQFEEEYAVDNATLKYTVYDKNHSPVTSITGNLNESRGYNYYELNVGDVELGSYATLEVQNAKGEKWYLRFTRRF